MATTSLVSAPATSTYNYTYTNTQWGDQLTYYRDAPFTYDALGNPLYYSNGSSYTFTWQNGRQLKSATKGSTTTTYTYNADGVRIGKTVGTVATEYALDGTTILAEYSNGVTIRYFYDANGAPVGMLYNGTRYHYEKNLQGDIIGIYNYAGTKLVSYAYDAWGNILSTTYTSGYEYLANANPFRYRGYYYDVETGFYYLQSRYYDPATGRFISADDPGVITATLTQLTDKNLYAYCDNNPITRADEGGNFWNVVAGAVVGGASSFVTSIVSDFIIENKINWTNAFISMGVGVVSGALSALLPSAGSAISSISNVVESALIDWKDGKDIQTIVVNSVVAGGMGLVTGSWENDFANVSLFDDAASAIPRIFKKNISKKAKEQLTELISSAGKHLAKSYLSSQFESMAIEGILTLSQFLARGFVETTRRNFSQ